MKTLKTAYEEAKSKLKTDKVWFNLGWHKDYLTGELILDHLEIPFDELTDKAKRLHVSGNEFEKGTKFCWVEDEQLCVGKDFREVKREDLGL